MGAKWVIGFLIIIYLSVDIEASQGDKSFWYQGCTQKCISKFNCTKSFGTFSWVHGDCFWCRYDCMWETIEHFERQFGMVPQFHGKWPFAAIPLPFGFVIQEPASVVFSLLNLYTVYRMLQRFLKMSELPMKTTWISYACVGLFAWISSSVFHLSDCDLTESMDYFGAYTFVAGGLYVSLVFTSPALLAYFGGRTGILTVLKILCGVFYLKHIRDMTVHFDYGYNMLTCIVYTIITCALYIHYIWFRYRRLGKLEESDILLIRIIIWANLSAALEILDFIPVFWIFDSHSLFHMATIPIPIWWAEFLDITHGYDTKDRKKYNVLKIA
ncbi:unnamed protein product [Caenorhabditis nigoni]|uniref:Post-GPI attachment to proteins factor 3 n=1 Tax=Caenorhabditis nigoni TaxID=1611254 RepID=A0A2G5TJU8_9PELO|nr:hypothetical protein B9Z55_019777 [Caenorhabditis nigoni]